MKFHRLYRKSDCFLRIYIVILSNIDLYFYRMAHTSFILCYALLTDPYWNTVKCKQKSSCECDPTQAGVSYASCRAEAAGEMPRTYTPSRILEDLRTEGTQISWSLWNWDALCYQARERLRIPRTEPNERLGSILGHGFLDDSSKGITRGLEYIRATISLLSVCYVNASKENVKR